MRVPRCTNGDHAAIDGHAGAEFDIPGAINGGKRGFLVELDPADIGKVVDVTPVDVAVD